MGVDRDWRIFSSAAEFSFTPGWISGLTFDVSWVGVFTVAERCISSWRTWEDQQSYYYLERVELDMKIPSTLVDSVKHGDAGSDYVHDQTSRSLWLL